MEHPRYESVKNGAKIGAGVVANLYDGVVDAVYSVGSGVAKGATKIVGAKYGKDAGEATDGALEGAGNVLKIVRIPKDELANTLKEWLHDYQCLMLEILIRKYEEIFTWNTLLQNFPVSSPYFFPSYNKCWSQVFHLWTLGTPAQVQYFYASTC